MYIKITKCDNENKWYYGHEGDTHEVLNESAEYYELRDSLLVKKSDARVLAHRFED